MKNNKSPYVIAEIGINHCGKTSIAKKLIDHAVKSGADAVKFQTYITEKLIKKNEPLMTYQKKNIKKKINQYQMLKRCELSIPDLKLLIIYSKKKKIDFISTPYDEESALLLIKLGLKKLKVASTDITNVPFLKFLLKKNVKLILSTGATSLNELNKIFKMINIKKYKKRVSILHCISFYPAPLSSLNLLVIKKINKDYNLNVGFSDHSRENFTGGLAVMMGAEILEKHITLNKNLAGPDHKASLEPKEFHEYVRISKNAKLTIGDGKKIVSKIEQKTKKKMQKSIFTKKTLNKGQKIRMQDLIIMRPASGISPMFIDKVLGKVCNKRINKSELIRFKDLQKI